MNPKNLKNQVIRAIDEVLPAKKVLKEAYVVEPKKFALNTEKLSAKVKKARIDHFEETVKTLNKISAELEGADPEDANKVGSAFRNQKVAEAFAINAAFLQGQFLDNISDVNSTITMDMLCYMRLARDFGTFDDWQKDFMACSLSSRCGWAVTYLNMYTQSYMNCVVDLHSQNVPAGMYPVIVMDVWQHSYYRDYLKDTQTYLSAMMKQLNWNVVEKRFEKADSILKIVRG